MQVEMIKASSVQCITKRGKTEIGRKLLADFTDLELDGMLYERRISQDLVNAIYEELARRKTNTAIAVARGDQELLEEIREALEAEGKAPNVAINLTNTEVKMLAEGRRLGII